jgi:L-aminopeptidase/D-esterase-like protein
MVMTGPLSDVAGVSIGHATLELEKTGCTVILFDQPALTAVDVRGAAPSTRELDLLTPGRTVQAADAILLTGGSAFGLRAADGVMRSLADRGRGFTTPAGPVPIVPAAVIYDLTVGEPVAPEAADGSRALLDAAPLSEVRQGQVGAGTGATWGKILPGDRREGGIGIAQLKVGAGLVTAVVVLNASGSLETDQRLALLDFDRETSGPGQATTLISVITSTTCDHGTLTRMCVAAHDALARKVIPTHTMLDGDVAFATTVSAGPIEPRHGLRLCMATEVAVEAALMRAAGLA